MEKNNELQLLKKILIFPSLIIVFFFLVIAFLIINYNNHQLAAESKHIKNDFIHFHKSIIKKEVEKIYEFIDSAQKERPDFFKHFTEKQIQKIVLEKIAAMNYNEEGYVFIVDYEGNYLLRKDQLNPKHKNVDHLKEMIIETARKGGGFISYMFPYSQNDAPSLKISYIEDYPKWNWAIGYGFHPDNIQPEIDQRIDQLKRDHLIFLKKISFVYFILAFILFLTLIILSSKIKFILKSYKSTIEQNEKKNKEQNEIIYHQSKMATIGELLNIISHQWRQPLSQINSLTLDTYLEQKQGTLNEDILKKNMSNIEDITKYLSQTIDDFGNYFIQEKDKKPFFCNNALNSSLKILAPTLENIDIRIELSSQNRITGFITLFQQVILTIITNSLDAFNINNIKNPGITIKSYDNENYTYLEISDNAGGIKEENINKIFDLYYSTKTKHSPSGLGLYIAKKIIENTMNGYISVQNIPNGVKFTIKVQNNGTK